MEMLNYYVVHIKVIFSEVTSMIKLGVFSNDRPVTSDWNS